MRRLYQATAFGFLGLSGFVVWEAWNLEYYTNLGPGPGFFPLWLGVAMGILSVVWLIGVSTGPRRAKETIFLSSRDGVLRILSILASLTAAAALMNFLGFQITLFLLLVFLLRGLGRQSLWLTLVVAVLGSVGVFRLFVGYLDVPLPKTAIRLLAGWGL